MTTWTELRTVALVGTERRPLPSPEETPFLDRVSADASPERTALHAAALLGVQRRVGAPVQTTDLPDDVGVDHPQPITEQFAPDGAVQLLELMLTGNAGPGSLSNDLFVQWFERCAERGYVLPHRLLVAVLDYATTSALLRDSVFGPLGTRGQWLATQRDKWSWTAPPTPDEPTKPSEIDLDETLRLSSARRNAVFVAARQADPAAGRRLIAEACSQLDAATRAQVLGLLADHLYSDDEDILEAALDDRSKGVRTTAAELLNGLTGSERARRLARWLEPLVTKSGTLRTTIKVTFPQPPEDEQLRDLPPDGRGVIEQQWFDALVAGTPLSWWEATLDMTPAKIVAAKLSHPDELLAAWSAAAIAQKNQPWLEALFDKTRQPALLAFMGNDAAAGAFLAGVADGANNHKQAALLNAVQGPWDAKFSQQVLAWVRNPKDQKLVTGRLNLAQTAMARNLAAESQGELSQWLDQVRAEEHQSLQRALRNIIQQLSLRTSINEAFA